MKTARRFLEEGHYQQIRYAIRSSLGASATKRSAFEPSATI
jgi:hypothetical protein